MTTEINGYTIFGAIEQKWIQAGREKSVLRLPIGNETPTFDGEGRFQQFEGGTVSWHKSTGANMVWGAIRQRWVALGSEKFGYPTNDESAAADGQGRFNNFTAVHVSGRPESSIFFHKDAGAHEIYGAIRAKWAELGWERSPVGYPWHQEVPTSDGKGRIQNFTKGQMTWDSTTGNITWGELTPELTLQAVKEDGSRYVVVRGFGFTPLAEVNIDYVLEYAAAVGQHQYGALVATTTERGDFDEMRIRPQSNLAGAQATAEDKVTGAKASGHVE